MNELNTLETRLDNLLDQYEAINIDINDMGIKELSQMMESFDSVKDAAWNYDESHSELSDEERVIIDRITDVAYERINEAKRRAAFEITKLVHGEEAAIKAEEATKAMFEGKGNVDAMESTIVEVGCTISEALVDAGIAPSKGQAKTLISQGAISLNDEKIDDIAYVLKEEDFKEGYAILRKGKKIYHKLTK